VSECFDDIALGMNGGTDGLLFLEVTRYEAKPITYSEFWLLID
jgi:hypothetical protein